MLPSLRPPSKRNAASPKKQQQQPHQHQQQKKQHNPPQKQQTAEEKQQQQQKQQKHHPALPQQQQQQPKLNHKQKQKQQQNPLAAARGKRKTVESLWHCKSGAGVHLFVSYYRHQPTGTCCGDGNGNGGSEGETGGVTVVPSSSSSNRSNLVVNNTKISNNVSHSIAAGKSTTVAAEVGYSRAAKRRRKKNNNNHNNHNHEHKGGGGGPAEETNNTQILLLPATPLQQHPQQQQQLHELEQNHSNNHNNNNNNNSNKEDEPMVTTTTTTARHDPFDESRNDTNDRDPTPPPPPLLLLLRQALVAAERSSASPTSGGGSSSSKGSSSKGSRTITTTLITAPPPTRNELDAFFRALSRPLPLTFRLRTGLQQQQQQQYATALERHSVLARTIRDQFGNQVQPVPFHDCIYQAHRTTTITSTTTSTTTTTTASTPTKNTTGSTRTKRSFGIHGGGGKHTTNNNHDDDDKKRKNKEPTAILLLSKANLQQVSPALKMFLVEHSSNGSLARQELGSMLPVLGLQQWYGSDPSTTTLPNRAGTTTGGSDDDTPQHADSRGQQGGSCLQTPRRQRRLPRRILDVCAAPGSKTLQLLEAFPHAKKIVANDVNPCRLEALQKALQRSGVPAHHLERIHFSCRDASDIPIPMTRSSSSSPSPSKWYDLVVADVPCSGDGTIRKDRHILPHWTPETALQLHDLQVRILVRALQLVRPDGGLVSYSTCSLNPIEDEAVVAAALQQAQELLRTIPSTNEAATKNTKPNGRLDSAADDDDDAKAAAYSPHAQDNTVTGHDPLSSPPFPPPHTPQLELVEWPTMEGLILRPGLTHWKVADYCVSEDDASTSSNQKKGGKHLRLDENNNNNDDDDKNNNNHHHKVNNDDDDDDDGEIPRLRWHDNYQDAVKAGMKLAVPSLWPPQPSSSSSSSVAPAQNGPMLQRCRRLWPQDQDTGGFFVALIRRNW